MTREIVLDTETTGLDPKQGHRLVEIGCVELVNRFQSGRTWHHYMNPERDMPEEAYRIHGISEAFLADKPFFQDLAEDFLAFIDGASLVIHNASFDLGFLNTELVRFGFAPITSDNVIDTLHLARRKFPGGPHNLDALCKRFGIDNTSRTLHGALLDSQLLAEVYVELTGGHQARLDLGGRRDAPSSGRERHGGQRHARQRPVALTPRLSDEERAAHRIFIESLCDKAAWRRVFEAGG